MKLILECSSSNENYSGGCDYALVDLTPTLAALALARIEMLNRMSQRDKEIYELRFWDYSPDWFSPHPEPQRGETKPDSSQQDALEELVGYLSEADYKQVPEDTAIPSAFRARTECNFMEVQDDSICWSCYPKYSDVTITTARIEVEVLREAAKQQEVEK